MKTYENGVHNISFEEIRNIYGFEECVEQYKRYCTNPEIKPEGKFNFEWYEKSNLNCFVIVNDNRCVGFCSIICSYDPHLNCNFLAIESLYIQKRYRGKYWKEVFKKIKTIAKEKNCDGIFITAGAGSRFERYLSLQFEKVNSVFWISSKEK